MEAESRARRRVPDARSQQLLGAAKISGWTCTNGKEEVADARRLAPDGGVRSTLIKVPPP